MFLLGIAGLAIVVILCHLWHNLVHFEKVLFDSDCYGVVYVVGTKLCSCISTFLPPESTCSPSTTIDLHAANVPDKVATVVVLIVVNTVV